MDNLFNGLNMNNLFETVQKMQEEMKKTKEELDDKTVEGSAGGDMVKVLISGNNEIRDIKIAKEVVDPEDIEMLQDLVTAAVNEGIRKATQMVQEEMSKYTSGFNIPGLNLNNMF